MAPVEKNDTKHKNVAAIFGVSGLVGKELARQLLSTSKWKVYGIARTPDNTHTHNPDYHFISCDLLDPEETQKKLSTLLIDTTHVFWITWASQYSLDSDKCSHQNKSMMSNVLNALLPTATSLKHFSLQTGMKHYVSLKFPPLGNFVEHLACYDEDAPRKQGNNFYYALEDLLQERLPGYDVSWAIHRPGLIMGCSQRTTYNFIGSLCVYGTICKYLNLPFLFGGTKQCWDEMFIDASDSRLVAEQHIWAGTTDTVRKPGHGEAYNAINGESYAWKEMWRAVGLELGVNVPANEESESLFSADYSYSSAMADKGGVWKEIVTKEGLVETEMGDLANWSFLDMVFRCRRKMLGTREKVDRLGFKTKYSALDSILYWIHVMKEQKFIP